MLTDGPLVCWGKPHILIPHHFHIPTCFRTLFTMPRPSAKVEYIKDELIEWYQNSVSFPTVSRKLYKKHDVGVADWTVKNSFKPKLLGLEG